MEHDKYCNGTEKDCVCDYILEIRKDEHERIGWFLKDIEHRVPARFKETGLEEFLAIISDWLIGAKVQ